MRNKVVWACEVNNVAMIRKISGSAQMVHRDEVTPEIWNWLKGQQVKYDKLKQF